MIDATLLIVSFFVILAGSELFTNGVEWMGEKLGIAEATVGSLLAAVGTALPETLIPAVALLTNWGDHSSRHAVGVGAIIGAPLMLSTVALAVMGTAALVYRKRRGGSLLEVPCQDARRDLNFFLPIFLTLILIGLGHFGQTFRNVTAVALVLLYTLYCVVMLKIQRSAEAKVEHGLHLEALLGGNPSDPRAWLVAIQVIGGTGLILLGAREFVDHIVRFAALTHLDPGVLSLIISPFATELPEKYNSVVWIRQGKDHLAFANISGAMVFQSCIPVALGIAFTPWHLTSAELLAGGVALLSTSILYLNLRDSALGTGVLMLGGAAYLCFLAGLMMLGVF